MSLNPLVKLDEKQLGRHVLEKYHDKDKDTTIFIIKAIRTHGIRYDYSKVKYINNRTYITIICVLHGEFTQTPNKHLCPRNCPKCANISRSVSQRKDPEDFKEECRVEHNNFYIYDKVIYNNRNSLIIIICPLHGEFTQLAFNHLNGEGCNDCANIARSVKQQLGKPEFVRRSLIIHKPIWNSRYPEEKLNIYNYDKVEYKNYITKVTIACIYHGDFEQFVSDHLRGCGCQTCGVNSKIKLQTKDEKVFIKQCDEKHDNFYDYSQTVYENCKSMIDIICPNHGLFNQRASAHLNDGQGCPSCTWYKTEETSRTIIEELMETKFPKKRPKWLFGLELDCYNENLKLAVEINGLQHYEFVPFFHETEEDFEYQKFKDQKKIRLCKEKKVCLIIIPHTYTYKKPKQLRRFIYKQLVKREFILEIFIEKN
jgi:hypothetical protein